MLRRDAPLLLPEEERRLLDAAARRPGPGGRDLVALQLASLLGLPPRHFIHLRVVDVSTDGIEIRAIIGAPDSPGRVPGRGAAIPGPLRDSLAALLAHRRADLPHEGEHASFMAGFLLVAERGSRLSQRRLRDVFQWIRADSGLSSAVGLALVARTGSARLQASKDSSS